MSNKIAPFTSISKFLEFQYEELHYIMERLNLLGALTPKVKEGGGRTFLIPDDNLMAEIRKYAYHQDSEQAAEILKSLIIMDCVENLREFQEIDQIVDYRKRRFPKVSRVDSRSGMLILENGAQIKYNNSFRAPNKQTNIMVYDLLGSVHKNQESADFSKIKKGGAKEKDSKRSADLKKKLFKIYGRTQVLAKKCIIAIVNHIIAEKNIRDDQDMQDKITAIIELSSSDAIISLYIILQPYRSPLKYSYLDDADLRGITDSNITRASIGVYDALISGVLDDIPPRYREFVKTNNERLALIAAAERDMSQAQPPSICGIMYKFVEDNLDNIAELRKYIYKKDRGADDSLALAEAELRLFSFMKYQDKDPNDIYSTEIERFVSSLENKYPLNGPEICLKKFVTKSQQAVYISIPYTILRSNILLYISGTQPEIYKSADDPNIIFDEDARVLIDIVNYDL